MSTIRRPIRHVLSLVGMGLMLTGLFGGSASTADLEPFDSQHDWVAQHPWGPQEYRGQHDPWALQDPWGDRHDRLRRRELGYGQPDHYTIHKGQKCEVQCTRVRGSREYRCREYRC
jgi:hypothetical protein